MCRHLSLITLALWLVKIAESGFLDEVVAFDGDRRIRNVSISLPSWLPPCLAQRQPVFEWRQLIPRRRSDPTLDDDDFESPDCLISQFYSDELHLERETVSLARYHCFYDGPFRARYRIGVTCGKASEKEGATTAVTFVDAIAILQHPSFAKIIDRSTSTTTGRSRRALTSGGIRFDKDSYVVNVTEELEPPVHIVTVRATDVDRLPLFYNLLAAQDARSVQLFKIDRLTGEINAVSRLDRELIGRHALRVSAYQGGNPSRSAVASVIVNVIDTNDHKPLFEKPVYVAAISETTDVGTTVLHVHAQDKDDGLNGDVVYSLVDDEDKPDSTTTSSSISEFSIDSKSGVLKTRRLLDRERQDFYRLKVNACDRAPDPNAFCSSALIEIAVDDENDNYPQFDRAKYQVEIREDADATFKPIVSRISATDRDAGENGKLHYSIVSGNTANKFAIDYETGEVRLLGRLNYKQNAQYELVVRAQDGGRLSLSNTTLLIVAVLDVNDHAPQFYHPSTSAVIREDASVGSFVTNVQAYDGDSGLNAAIKYTLILDPDDEQKQRSSQFPFELNESTGTITVKSTLDRETVPLYDFNVLATDGGSPPLSSTVRVLIHVSDVNDNAPSFQRKIYNITVPENTSHGAQVLRLSAYDPDEASSRLDYSISAGNEEKKFLLVNQGDSGQLTINGKLDYKQRSIYSLSVKATDSGGQHDTATVYVYVDDVNSPPFFNEHPFVVRVYENEHVGNTVAVVQASDDDEGKFARLTYTMDGDQGGGYFRIDPQTGVISVNRSLDRETYPRFDLRIVATDGGEPPLSATTHLEVVLDDANDNAPVFLQQNYTTVISENAVLGHSFFQVSATDADDGSNGRILYFFGKKETETNGESDDGTFDDGTFKIDASSGIIRVQKTLDRERIADYYLPVVAVDKGTPSLSGTALVHIALTDINDNSPRFADTGSDGALHFFVPENSPLGTKVARVVATDADIGANARVVYKITGGADMASFDLSSSVDQDGGVELLTRVQLDYESKKNVYHLQLEGKSGDLTTPVDVYVHVLDVNDHAPVLNDFYVIFNNYEDQFPLNQPGRVPAYDPDANDTLTFRIVRGNEAELLLLDSRTGRLTLGANLNTNRQVDASLRICVSDGANEACSTCRLRTVYVTEEMLLNSVTIRVKDTNVHSFLNPSAYNRFIDAVATLLPSNRDDVFIFSVNDDGPVLNISFSIRKPGKEQFVSSGELRELIYLNQGLLKMVSHIDILPFEDNLCVREPCLNYERCQNVLKFGEAPDFITTDTFLFRPVHPVNTFVCVCPEGFAGMTTQYMCDTEVNLCYSSPCGLNGTCKPKEGGYTCVCPPDSTGPHCEFPLVTDFCLPGICAGGSHCDVSTGRLACRNCPYPPEVTTEHCQLTTRTFTKRSYVTLPPLKARNRFQIRMSFATIDPNGLLLYNGRYHPHGDFIALTLENGRLSFKFSIGDEKVIDARFGDEAAASLADGKWHTAVVAYSNRTVTLSYDDCDEAIALGPSSATTVEYPRCAVRVTHELDKICTNPTVPCFRFLDLAGPFYVGGLTIDGDRRRFRIESENFHGCIRDLNIDERAIDFERVVANVGSEAGCKHLNDGVCSKKPCKNMDGGQSCSTIWNGHKCECGDRYNGQNCTDDVSPSRRLTTPESNIVYELPSNFPLPFAMGISFRTRQSDLAALSAEFTNKRHISLKLINNRPLIEHGDDQFSLTHHSILSDGNWHTLGISVAENHLNASIDFVTVGTFVLKEPFFGGITKIFAGSASPASKSAESNERVLSCVKGAFFGRTIRHPQYLKIEHHSGTEGGCKIADACSSNPCPSNSRCTQEWESYSCRCSPGFVGGRRGCVDVCSLNPCMNGGTCDRTRDGYRCKCPSRYSGRRCEILQPLAGDQCPKNWWGYPLCAPCKCPVNKGYEDCDKQTGACRCKTLHYQPPNTDRCLPCDCYYPAGATNATCDYTTGQCPCRGDVIGRRCDSCHDRNAQIDRVLGKCQIAPNSCPENFDEGILWPRTSYGVSAHRPCPKGLHGTASRRCNSETELWSQSDLFNCSSSYFEGLRTVLNKLDTDLELTPYLSKRIASELKNATEERSDRLYGRDLYVAYRLILNVLRRELNQPSNGLSHYSHIQDKRFVENLIRSCNVVLSPRYYPWWSEMTAPDGGRESIGLLLQGLHDYGFLLARNHVNGVTRPFRLRTDNIYYSVDTVNTRGSAFRLPKYDNLVFDGKRDGFGVQIDFPAAKSDSEANGYVFYAVYDRLADLVNPRTGGGEKSKRAAVGSSAVINSPVVSLAVLDSGGRSIRQLSKRFTISFPWLDSRNRTKPRCVWWEQKENSRGVWQRSGCEEIVINRTHVVCSCNHLSTFAVSVDGVRDGHDQYDDDGIHRWLSNYVNMGVTGLTVLLLLIVALHSCCCRENFFRHSNNRSILKSIVTCFCLCEIAFVFVDEAGVSDTPCKTVGAILQFGYLSLFVWTLLYLVHLYRMVTEVKDVDRGALWIYCLIGWGLPMISVGLTAVLSAQSWRHEDMCWFDVTDPFMWSMAGPIALVLLISLYVAGLCAMIGYSKEWQVLSSKFNFRDQLATTLITQSLFICQWLLAMAVVNWRLAYLQYLYDLIALITTAVLLYMIVRHKSPPLEGNAVLGTTDRWPSSRICCWRRSKSYGDEEESSKFGARYPPEDPSATVSRPDSPILSARSMMGDRGHPPLMDDDREDDADCDEMQEEVRRLTEFHQRTPPPAPPSNMVNFSRAATLTGSPAPRIRLNSFNSPLSSMDDFGTMSAGGVTTPQSVVSDILTLRRPIKPDVIPSWEAAAANATAGAYATIRRPLVSGGGGRASSAQASILSPVQKVLSDSEGEDSPVAKRFHHHHQHQRDRFQTFVSPVGYAVLPTSSANATPNTRRVEYPEEYMRNFRT